MTEPITPPPSADRRTKKSAQSRLRDQRDKPSSAPMERKNKRSRQDKLKAKAATEKMIEQRVRELVESVNAMATELPIDPGDVLAQAAAAVPVHSAVSSPAVTPVSTPVWTPASAPVGRRDAKPPLAPERVVEIVASGEMRTWTPDAWLDRAEVALKGVQKELVKFTLTLEKEDRTTSDLRRLRDQISDLEETIGTAVAKSIQAVFFPTHYASASKAGEQLIERVGLLPALELVFRGVWGEDLKPAAARARLHDKELFANLGTEHREEKRNNPTKEEVTSVTGVDEFLAKAIVAEPETGSPVDRAALLFPSGAYPRDEDDDRRREAREIATEAAADLAAANQDLIGRKGTTEQLRGKKAWARFVLRDAGKRIVHLLYYPDQPAVAEAEYRRLDERIGPVGAFAEAYFAATLNELAPASTSELVEPHRRIVYQVQQVYRRFEHSFGNLKGMYHLNNPVQPGVVLNEEEQSVRWMADPHMIAVTNRLALRALVECEKLLDTRPAGTTAEEYVTAMLGTYQVDLTVADSVPGLLASYLATALPN